MRTLPLTEKQYGELVQNLAFCICTGFSGTSENWCTMSLVPDESPAVSWDFHVSRHDPTLQSAEPVDNYLAFRFGTKYPMRVELQYEVTDPEQIAVLRPLLDKALTSYKFLEKAS